MPRLVRVVESLWAQSGPFLNFLYSEGDIGTPVGPNHGHLRVTQALKAGDSDAAARAIAADIAGGGRDLMRRLAD
jgi:DNA-binding GntR family transcriptional regulator